MKTPYTPTLFAICMGLAVAPAFAQELKMPDKCLAGAHMMNMGEADHMMDMPMQDFQKDLMAGMQKMDPAMMQAMMLNDPDAAFYCGMIAHHIGAVEMARTELKYGKDESVKAMAQKIIDAQIKEIGDMSKWVEDNVK